MSYQSDWAFKEGWRVKTVDGSQETELLATSQVTPMVVYFTVDGNTQGPEMIQRERWDSLQQMVRVDWAKPGSCTFTTDGRFLGLRLSDNKAFTIVRSVVNGKPELTCTVEDSVPQRRWLVTAALSAFLGALIGAAAGAAGSRPMVGALIGLAAALTGWGVTAAQFRTTGSVETNTGSSATWVAEEGREGGRRKAPHLLHAAGA